MTLLAPLFTAAAVYWGVGLLTGYAPKIRPARRSAPVLSRRRLWLVQAGSDLSVLQFTAGSAAAGFAVFVLASMVTGAWWLGAAPAAGAALTPRAFYSRRRTERLRRLREAWPDALRDMSAAIAAGSTLVLALYDLADSGPLPLRPAFVRFRRVSRMTGVVPALELVKEELGDPTSDRVIEVLALAYQHGGSLIEEVLRDLVREITEDLRLEADIRADGAEQRIESWVVLIIPWLMLMFLTATAEQYQTYYRSADGLIVVAAAAGWSLIGVLIMRRLGRAAVERRVLVRPEARQGEGGAL